MERFFYRGIRFVMLCCISFAITSCREKIHTPEDEPTPQTLIVYMVGTDLSWAFDYNISDIKSALSKNIKGQSRVIIVKHSDKETLKAVELEYVGGEIEEKDFATYNLPVKMDESSLGYIFNDITSRAPANSYGLIIGSHGWGWIPWSDFYSQIETNGLERSAIQHLKIELPREYITRFLGEKSTLSNTFDITTLSEALHATGKKFEYILFDACFMGNVEAAYDLRNNTKYIVASLCEIMGKGFPYQKTLPYLLQNGGKAYDLNSAAKSFNEHYKTIRDSGSDLYSGSIAVINCAELESLAQKMREVNRNLSDMVNERNLQTYDGGTNHIFYDLGDYVNETCTDEACKKAFAQQMEITIPHKHTLSAFWSGYINLGSYPIDTEAFSGLTTSAPSRLCRESYPQTTWYKATH